MNWPLLRVTVARWQHSCRGSSNVRGWERVQLGKTVPQPKGNFLFFALSWLWFNGGVFSGTVSETIKLLASHQQ